MTGDKSDGYSPVSGTCDVHACVKTSYDGRGHAGGIAVRGVHITVAYLPSTLLGESR